MRLRPEWLPGNRIELLENGEQYYPRVFAAIEAAREEVLLETFIWFDDPVGRRLREALAAAARRGVAVHVLFDGWGSPEIDETFLRPLVEAGGRPRAFEPAKTLFGLRLNLLRRMHRKLVVVDARLAFVGGINYSIDHLRVSGEEAKQDYAVQVEGPLVAQIHGFCRASLSTPQPPRERWRHAYRRLRDPQVRRRWVDALGRGARAAGRAWRERRDRRSAAPGAASATPATTTRPPAAAPPEDAPPTVVGEDALAAFVTRDNHLQRDDIERQYRLAMRLAARRIVIANAYFFPGWRLLSEMRRAVRRGVQVDLILQGTPDMAIVRTAASLLHAHLVGAGVRIHEYCERPLHGKVAVIDDTWATVGSSNLDPISLGLNLEANVLVRDGQFAGALCRHLDALVARSCRAVEVPTPGPLLGAWIALRSALVFHFLRRFPRWASRLPSQQPRVASLRANRA